MKAFPLTSLVGFAGLGLLFLACSAQAKIAPSGDPEDSPLYAASRGHVFAEMAARDQAPQTLPVNRPGAVVQTEAIIVVEGTKWYPLPTTGGGLRPRPLGVTMDVTCAGWTTCAGMPTCSADVTCGATCINPTCAGSGQATCAATCSGPTCGQPTCGGMTCAGWQTCSGTTCQTTCAGMVTCADTCSLAYCSPPSISGVIIPQPGQIQFSFLARGEMVSYNVECSTNLAVAQWQTIYSISANNSIVTFNHTNDAPRAFYRLSLRAL